MFTTCPECHEPSEVIDRYILESTEGPIEHQRIMCINRHGFTLPVEMLERMKYE